MAKVFLQKFAREGFLQNLLTKAHVLFTLRWLNEKRLKIDCIRYARRKRKIENGS